MNELSLSIEDVEALLKVMRESGRPATFDCTNRRIVVLGPIQKHPTVKMHDGRPMEFQEKLLTIKEGK